MAEHLAFLAFAVCGLGQPLVSINGDHGIQRRPRARYRAGLLEQLSLGNGTKLPQQLPACCLPGGVEVLLPADVDIECGSSAPLLYSVVLTDESGKRLYASCLSYMDAVPALLASRHEHLLGAKATCALCLLCRQPYLATAEQVLRRIFVSAFCTGSSAPVADIIAAVLRVPSPLAMRCDVRFEVEGRRFLLRPPDDTGVPRDAEVPLRPALEALSPANLLTVLLAVLLDRRVVLASGQLRLPTLVGEALGVLLWPFRYPHVYVPLVPAALTDLLDAPTPFLMGLGGGLGAALAAELHAACAGACGGVPGAGGGGGSGGDGEFSEWFGGGVAARVAEGLVVADLDRDCVYGGWDLTSCMEHPAVKQLVTCLSALMRPAASGLGPGGSRGSGALGHGGSEAAPEIVPVVGLASSMQEEAAMLLRSEGRQHRPHAAIALQGLDAEADPWMAIIHQAAASGWGCGHEALVRRLFLRLFATLLKGYHAHLRAGTAAPSPVPPLARASSLDPFASLGPERPSPSAPWDTLASSLSVMRSSRPSPSAPPLKADALVKDHAAVNGPSALPLLQQLLHSHCCFALVEEYGRTEPYAWYRTACASLRPELDALQQSAVVAEGAGAHLEPCARTGPFGQDAAAVQPAAIEVPPCRTSLLLQQRKAPVHRTFPALNVSDEVCAGGVLPNTNWLGLGLGVEPPPHASMARGARNSSAGGAHAASLRGTAGGAAAIRKRPSVHMRPYRITRSFSGSLSTDTAPTPTTPLPAPDTPRPRPRRTSAGAIPVSTDSGAAPPTSNTANPQPLPLAPSLVHGHVAGAAAAHDTAAPLGPSPFASAFRLCPSASGAAPNAVPWAQHNGPHAPHMAQQQQHYHQHHHGSQQTGRMQLLERQLLCQQNATLVQVLAWGQSRKGGEGGTGSGGQGEGGMQDTLPSEGEVLSARRLLCLQVGGNGGCLLHRLREAIPGAADTPQAASGRPSGEGGSGPSSSSATSGSGGGRCLHRAAFGVLADAVDAVVCAAVRHGNWDVVEGVLELGMQLYTHTGRGTRVLLLHTLSSNPYLFTCYTWAGLLSNALVSLALDVSAASEGEGRGSGGSTVAVVGDSGRRTGAGLGAAEGTGEEAEAAPLPPEEARLRQRKLLRALEPKLCAYATWMMHLGVAEEAGWETLSRLVAAAGVGELPAAQQQGALSDMMAAVRASLRCAKLSALHQHRRRMGAAPDPAALRLALRQGTVPPAAGCALALPPPPLPSNLQQQHAQQQVQQPLLMLPAPASESSIAGGAVAEAKAGVGAAGGAQLCVVPQQRRNGAGSGVPQATRTTSRSSDGRQLVPMSVAPPIAGHSPRLALPAPPSGLAAEPSAGSLPLRSLSAAAAAPPPPGLTHTRETKASTTSLVRLALVSSPAAAGGPGARRPRGGAAGTSAVVAVASAVSPRGTLRSGVYDGPRPCPGGITAAASGTVRGTASTSAPNTYRASPRSNGCQPRGSCAPGALAAAPLGPGGAAGAVGSPPVSARGCQVKGEVTRGQSPAGSGGGRREAAGAGRCRASLEGRFIMQDGDPPEQPSARCSSSSLANPSRSSALTLPPPSGDTGFPGRGQPSPAVVALAAAGGVVLAAPQDRALHVLTCREDGSLRHAALMPLLHLDGAHPDTLALALAATHTGTAATAAVSMAPPLPPAPPPPWPSALDAVGLRAGMGTGSAAPRLALMGPGSEGAAGVGAGGQQSRSRVIAVVDVAACRVVQELRSASCGRTTALSFLGLGPLLLSGCSASWARLWDVRTASSSSNPSPGGSSPVVCIPSRQGGITCMATLWPGQGALGAGVGGGGSLLAMRLLTGGRDGTVAEWDLRKATCPVRLYTGHRGGITAMALLPSDATHPSHAPPPASASTCDHGPQLLTASSDWTCRLWDPRDALPHSQLTPGGPDDGSVLLGDSYDGALGGVGAQHGGSALAAAAAAGGGLVCGRPRAVLVGHGAPVTSVCVVQDSVSRASTVFTGAQDGSVGAWRPDGSLRAMMHQHHGGPVRLVAPWVASHTWLQSDTCHRSSGPAAGGCGGHGSPAGVITAGGDGSASAWALPGESPVPSECRYPAVAPGGVWGGGWGPGEGTGPVLGASYHTRAVVHCAAVDTSSRVVVAGGEGGVVHAWAPGL